MDIFKFPLILGILKSTYNWLRNNKTSNHPRRHVKRKDVFLDILNEIKEKNELAELKLEKETSKVKKMIKGSKVLLDKDELLDKLAKGSKGVNK